MSHPIAAKDVQQPRPEPETALRRFLHTDLFVSMVVSVIYLSILSVLVASILC